jgi:hypothetical protein
MRPEDAGNRKVHGAAEVKLYIVDVSMPNGERDNIMVSVAGDQMVVLENKGRAPSNWLKEAIFARINKRDGGTEQV